MLTIGYLITEAERVTLTLADGTPVDAEPLAYDHETGFGMVRALDPLGVTPLPIGSAAALAQDDPVVIASFGGYDHAIAAHVVSKREFAGSWEYMLDEAIFTTPMHPYWGGAALIDREGKLVGTGSLFTQEPIAGDQSRQSAIRRKFNFQTARRRGTDILDR